MRRLPQLSQLRRIGTLIAEATNPVRRSKIGPLKREDGSLAVNEGPQ